MLGVMGPEAGHFFRDLSRRIAVATSDALSHQYLQQWVAIAVQRGNAVAVLGTAERDAAVGQQEGGQLFYQFKIYLILLNIFSATIIYHTVYAYTRIHALQT